MDGSRGVNIKRALDLAILLVFAPLWLPLLAIIALIVRIALGSPIFFTQLRPGFRGRPFRIIKFRSMLDARSSDGHPLPDGARLTPFGRWLRSTSLDELPELFNVLRGDMSLVGPRPLLMEYLPLYSPAQARRHEVQPGITGWAQVKGRNALSWEEKFELDVWYVDHRTNWLDMKILGATAKAVLARRGITYAGEATMPRFLGTRR
jgi:sugar transferase EpsL